MNQDGTPSQAPTHMWALDNIRAVAVLSVLLYHTNGLMEQSMAQAGATLFPQGLGLDIFFMLSGFLVWKVTHRKGATPGPFMWQRITRIAPLYTLLTLAYLPFLNLDLPTVGFHDKPNWTQVLLSLSYLPSITVIKPGWTLIYDMFYFVLFAVVLIFPRKNRLLVASIVFLIPPALHLVTPHNQNMFLVFYTNIRAISFLIGIWIAECHGRKITAPLTLAKAMLIVSTLGYILLFYLRIEYHGVGALIWMMVAAGSLLGTVSIEAAGSTFWKTPFCTPIARWSFAIYLGQVFTIPIGFVFTPGPVLLKMVVAIALSVAFGAALHIWVEQPINGALTRFEKKRQMRGSSQVAIAP